MNKVEYGPNRIVRASRVADIRNSEIKVSGRKTQLIEALSGGRLTISHRVNLRKTLHGVNLGAANGGAHIRYTTDVPGMEKLYPSENSREVLDMMTLDHEEGGQIRITKNAGAYYVQENVLGRWRQCTRREVAEITKLETVTGRQLIDYYEMGTEERGIEAEKWGQTHGVNLIGDRLAGPGPGSGEYEAVMRMTIDECTGTPTYENSGVNDNAVGDWYGRSITTNVTINDIAVPRTVIKLAEELTTTNGRRRDGRVDPGKTGTEESKNRLSAELAKTGLTAAEQNKLLTSMTSAKVIAVLIHLNDQTSMYPGEKAFMDNLCWTNDSPETTDSSSNRRTSRDQSGMLTHKMIDRSKLQDMVKINHQIMGDGEYVSGRRESISTVAITEVDSKITKSNDAKLVIVKQSALVAAGVDATLRTWEEMKEQRVQKIMWGTCVELPHDAE